MSIEVLEAIVGYALSERLGEVEVLETRFENGKLCVRVASEHGVLEGCADTPCKDVGCVEERVEEIAERLIENLRPVEAASEKCIT